MHRRILSSIGTAPFGFLAVTLAAPAAQAQIEQVPSQQPGEVMDIATDDPNQRAVDGEVWRRQADRRYGGYERGPDSGLRLGGGLAFTRDVEDGWYGRLEWVIYDQYRPGSGGSFLTLGAEGWGAEEAAGGSVPYSINFGLESGVFFASFGLVFDLFLYDKVYEEGGWGLFAPGAAAGLGLTFDGFRIAAEARGKYRWQFQAPDRTQALTGLFVEVPL